MSPSSHEAKPKSPHPPSPTVGGPPQFSILGIPVRIGLGFWFIAILYASKNSISSALISILVIFVSILIHELGHAFMAQKFGAKPAITLHIMGGLTTYADTPMSRWQRILVSFAGPLGGLILGAAVFLIARKFQLHESQKQIVHLIVAVNLGWSLLNLLPVLPFDGGNIVAAALGPRRAFATSIISASVSIFIALYAAIVLHNTTGLFLAILFGSAGFNSILQARLSWALRSDIREGLDLQLARAKMAIDHEELDQAQSLIEDVLLRSRTPPIRNGGWAGLAWVYVLRGESVKAQMALKNITSQQSIDPYLLAVVDDATGNTARAIELLEEIREAGLQNTEMVKHLIDMYARSHRLDFAIQVAIEDAHLLIPEDVRAVMLAAIENHDFEHAANLAARLFELHGSADYAVDEARVWAKAGDVDKTLHSLLKAVATGAVDVLTLKNDPAFSSFVHDARFEKIWGSSP